MPGGSKALLNGCIVGSFDVEVFGLVICDDITGRSGFMRNYVGVDTGCSYETSGVTVSDISADVLCDFGERNCRNAHDDGDIAVQLRVVQPTTGC